MKRGEQALRERSGKNREKRSSGSGSSGGSGSSRYNKKDGNPNNKHDEEDDNNKGDKGDVPMVLESVDEMGRKRYKLENWKGDKQEKPGFKSRPIYFTEPFNIYLLWRVLLLEYIGTTLFVFFACGSVVSSQSFGLSTAATAALAALIQGLAIATFVYAISHTTGGHINPAVTLCLVISGHVGIIRGICYIIVQVIGGITGAALLLAVIPFPYDREVYLGVTQLNNGTSPFQGWLFEFIMTFALLFTIYGTAINVESSASGSHVLAPLPIGFAVFIGVGTAYNFTGGSLNPARTFGPALVGWNWERHYIYWLGPIAASVVVGLLERYVLLVVVDKDSEKQLVPGNGNMCTQPEVEELSEVDDDSDDKDDDDGDEDRESTQEEEEEGEEGGKQRRAAQERGTLSSRSIRSSHGVDGDDGDDGDGDQIGRRKKDNRRHSARSEQHDDADADDAEKDKRNSTRQENELRSSARLVASPEVRRQRMSVRMEDGLSFNEGVASV